MGLAEQRQREKQKPGSGEERKGQSPPKKNPQRVKLAGCPGRVIEQSGLRGLGPLEAWKYGIT